MTTLEELVSSVVQMTQEQCLEVGRVPMTLFYLFDGDKLGVLVSADVPRELKVVVQNVFYYTVKSNKSYAYVIVSEAWMANYDPGDEAKFEAAKRDGLQGKPEAKEVLIYAGGTAEQGIVTTYSMDRSPSGKLTGFTHIKTDNIVRGDTEHLGWMHSLLWRDHA